MPSVCQQSSSAHSISLLTSDDSANKTPGKTIVKIWPLVSLFPDQWRHRSDNINIDISYNTNSPMNKCYTALCIYNSYWQFGFMQYGMNVNNAYRHCECWFDYNNYYSTIFKSAINYGHKPHTCKIGIKILWIPPVSS